MREIAIFLRSVFDDIRRKNTASSSTSSMELYLSFQCCSSFQVSLSNKILFTKFSEKKTNFYLIKILQAVNRKSRNNIASVR